VEDGDKGDRGRLASSAESGSGASTNHRLVVALFWIAAQAALVVTAGRRADGAFGFRMFSESSTIKLALHREIDGPDGRRVWARVDEGVWSARASDGTYHRLTWYDRVPAPIWIFDQEMHASYGAAAQLSRLQAALDHLATHTAATDDVETHRFALDVVVRRNGREPTVHRLTSRERLIPSPGTPADSLHDGGR
jgi:hypothetical protein